MMPEPEYAHGFRLDEDACDGCMACMRVCPTDAIRVKHGKASVRSVLCIDCGSCLNACTRQAITATTHRLDEIANYTYKVAVPSPVLFGQFPHQVRPEHIVKGLLAAGFDAVWDYGVELRIGMLATVDYLEHWAGPRPLINTTCPVILRLVQVSYPRMCEQLVQMQPPRELAGRAIKRRYSQERSLSPDDVAAIYITACQARAVSILQPAEGGTSCLDGFIGIAQIYNSVLAEARLAAQAGTVAEDDHWSPVRSRSMLSWATPDALYDVMRPHGYMGVTGLPNVIDVLDDVERGRLKGIDFLECYACWGGCANGNLTVDNVYVTLAKLQTISKFLPLTDPATEREVERRLETENYGLERPFKPRPIERGGDLRERVRRVQEVERVTGVLPGLNCGLCGTPSCSVLARDVAADDAAVTDCVFLSRSRLEELRRLHLRSK
jgi:Fe-S-cluster-containing hydrogenase component 2